MEDNHNQNETEQSDSQKLMSDPQSSSEEQSSQTSSTQPEYTPGEVINTDNQTPTNVSKPQVNEPADPVNDPNKTVTTDSKPKKHVFRPELIFIPPIRRWLGTKARPAAIVVMLVVLLALGGLSSWRLSAHHSPIISNKKTLSIASSFKLLVVPFQLTSTIPTSNATNVNTATSITLNFNQPVTPDKLVNNMFLTPKVSGTFSQGSNPEQVIFKPSAAFSQGTKISVMINGTYESNSGAQLGNAYEYVFTTAIPNNGVLFQDQNGLIDEVSSLASGQKETFSLLVGSNVGSGASISLYKGDVTDMLNSLIYAKDSSGVPSFSNLSVSTSSLQKISTMSNVANNASYSVNQPDGLYVAVATDSSGKEVGLVWIDFSNFGALLRQDDQKIVVDTQALSNSTDVPASISFYNLNNSVSLLTQKTVNGLTTINFPYSPSVDLAVATYNSETAVVPVNIPDSGGDIRVEQNLSNAQAAYGLTDRPTYKVGESVQYAGYLRADNDAQYTNSGAGSVNLYVASYKGGTAVDTFSAPVDSSGMFSGSITPQSSWLNSGDSFDQLQIFVAASDGNHNDDLPLAGFVLTSQPNAADSISVKFNKSSYLASDQISATITATDSSGQPLANQSVDVHTFSQDYYENNPSANLENFGYVGNELPGSPAVVKLNSLGQATFSVKASALPADGNSQLVTIQANLPNQTGVGAAGGASAVVHQGNAILTFGLERTAIPSGSGLISDIYATNLSGSPLVSTSVNYKLMDTTTTSTLASGTVTTNPSGMAEVSIPSGQLSNDGMQLQVSTTDSSGNIASASNYFSVQPSSYNTFDTSGAGLFNLNISGSSGQVQVGDTVNLTINSPANLRTIVTMDRGRIYNPAVVNLNSGDNSYSFKVTQDMAPSFTLTISYFLNGAYHSEGVNFNVSESSNKAKVTIANTTPTVAADKPVNLSVSTTNSGGSPIVTSLIVDVVSKNSYNLNSAVTPDIFSALFDSRPIMTSSSSSLSAVGSGGGRCGGGGGNLSSYANPDGTTLSWQPKLTTDLSGKATVSFTPPSGSWVVKVYAMSSNTQVGSAATTITAK